MKATFPYALDDIDPDIGLALERLAASQPGAAALHVPGRTSLTYADIGSQLRYVRERLVSWGVTHGDIVAGVIPTRPEMAVACATVASTATFAPLSPAFTTDTYSELLSRLRPKALIVSTGLDHAVRAAARRCGVAEIELAFDPSAPAGIFSLHLARGDESLRRADACPPDTAYIITTSGTTGRQKLVPISRRALALRARVDGDWFGFTPSDVGFLLSPIHLSSGLRRGLMIPLLLGMTIICLPDSDVGACFDSFGAYQPTWLQASFTMHREILRRAPEWARQVSRTKLRFVRVDSGPLEPDEIDRIEQTLQAPLLVSYSSSETSVITTSPMPPRKLKRGSVGVPVMNEVAVMNDEGRLCRAGEIGEIVVRGALVFDGYFDDPQANAAAFIGKWFRTGDLGRFDEDGCFYLAGRIKEIISRGGEKISPAEVDAALAMHPGVHAAAAFAIPHPTLGEELVAAVVKAGDQPVEEAELIEQVRQQLGDRPVPRRIYFTNQLPLTDNGKVRRSELPRLLGLDLTPADAPKKPAPAASLSPVEAALVGLWSSVLQVGSVGVNDDFFLLGGDSLRGAQLLNSIKAVFGVDIALRAVFSDAATVAGMALAIEAARSGDTISTAEEQRREG